MTMTFILVALAPSLCTLIAVSLALLALMWGGESTHYRPDVPLDWAALEEELDTDAGWEAIYVATMGCNRGVRCRARCPMARQVSRSMGRRLARPTPKVNVGQRRRMHTPEQNVGQRGPPPHPGDRAGKPSANTIKNDFRNTCKMQPPIQQVGH